MNLRMGILVLNLWMAVAALGADEPKAVRFNRDVRPILAENCFRCHGPDAAARQAELRLDQFQDATRDRSGYRVIDPVQPADSELIRRITAADVDQRMPPHDSGSTLSREDIQILQRWINDGAPYEPHWSFVAPRRASLPPTHDSTWSRNAIDRYVLSRLEQEGLTPSPAADPATLIRRVTLDLTGLPPTLEEVDAFERESRRLPELAYQRLVDRLLASPRYGERMALAWLDAARYADTNGYFTDNDRTMWLWRDWVIEALNENMPFDRFTIEQLAGDLLPESTVSRKIATGFNRNHMVNNETGIVDEEFRTEYVVDRVDTTATVWMGLTMGCARCHDHKYDPISQKDFYRFFAFFNNVPEKGLDGSNGNAAPLLKVPSASQQAELDRLRVELAAAKDQFAAVEPELTAAQLSWEATAVDRLPPAPAEGLVAHYALDDDLSALQTMGPVYSAAGMIGKAARFEGDACIRFADEVPLDRDRPFSVAAWIHPASAGCILSQAEDTNDMRGFDITLRKGKAVVNLAHRWDSNAIQVSTVSSIPNNQWQHLVVTFDGSSRAAGVGVYLDGRRQAVETHQDSLSDSIRNRQPVRIGRRQSSASFEGMIDDVRIYDRQLSGDEVHRLFASQLVAGVVAQPAAERSADKQRKLRGWFIEQHADADQATAFKALEQLQLREQQLLDGVPTTMMMQEQDTPRQAVVLVRGSYDQPGEQVTADIPSFLRGSQGDLPGVPNRLDLARWLVAPTHPLTARVTVNRLWQQLFGIGIVKTADDFGTQGDWPSHPELLDWLALELIESGWDMKHLVRLMVTSATYRQSAAVSPQLFDRDPENRLLARGPRFRMEAETLRDNALAVSGLLVEKTGGPSVKPYQPAGLWEAVTYDSDRAYDQDDGESLYRRSLYTFWKRQAPPPNMLVFDAPTRETCIVQRSRTNTPLQALVLMNDPTFVEAARQLAERTMMAADGNEVQHVEFMFRTVTARRPAAKEIQVLLDVFHQQRSHFQNSPDGVERLLAIGHSTHRESLDREQLAAWTTVASMILCLDETITKP